MLDSPLFLLRPSHVDRGEGTTVLLMLMLRSRTVGSVSAGGADTKNGSAWLKGAAGEPGREEGGEKEEFDGLVG